MRTRRERYESPEPEPQPGPSGMSTPRGRRHSIGSSLNMSDASDSAVADLQRELEKIAAEKAARARESREAEEADENESVEVRVADSAADKMAKALLSTAMAIKKSVAAPKRGAEEALAPPAKTLRSDNVDGKKSSPHPLASLVGDSPNDDSRGEFRSSVAVEIP